MKRTTPSSDKRPDPTPSPQSDEARQLRGARLFLLALAGGIGLTLLYALLTGFSGGAWSDALCVSAIALGLAGTLPALLDVGRGFAMPVRMARGQEARERAMAEDQEKRERGTGITFALALAALCLGLLSFLVGLW